MTYPDDQPIPQLPDPPDGPPPPNTTGIALAERKPSYIITVPLSRCCGALPGDVCDCAAFTAECLASPQIPWPGKDDPVERYPDWWS